MRGNRGGSEQSLWRQAVSVFIVAVLIFSAVKILKIDNVFSLNEWRLALANAGATLDDKISTIPDNLSNAVEEGGNNNSSGTNGGGNSSSGDSTADEGTGSNEEGSTASETTSATNVETLLASLVIGEAQTINYDRGEWRHWDGYGSSCWNIREEVLYRQSDPNKIIIEDSQHNTTTDKTKACYIKSGSWDDPYTGKNFTNPGDLDMDHMIPLSYAARHGGQAWDAETKSEYANSLNDGHLIGVMASANRQKSDKGPSEWKPQASYQCEYAKIWIDISVTWNLTTAQADYNALEDMLNKC